MSFALDERLASDTLVVGDMTLSRVLLMNDARWPWLILVPRRERRRRTHRSRRRRPVATDRRGGVGVRFSQGSYRRAQDQPRRARQHRPPASPARRRAHDRRPGLAGPGLGPRRRATLWRRGGGGADRGGSSGAQDRVADVATRNRPTPLRRSTLRGAAETVISCSIIRPTMAQGARCRRRETSQASTTQKVTEAVMSDAFQDRENTFEKQFAHDEDLRFKAVARRNKALALWVAEMKKLSQADAEKYADAFVAAQVGKQRRRRRRRAQGGPRARRHRPLRSSSAQEDGRGDGRSDRLGQSRQVEARHRDAKQSRGHRAASFTSGLLVVSPRNDGRADPIARGRASGANVAATVS